MKVTAEHLEQLRAAIEPYDTDTVRALYAAGDIPRREVVKDFDKRYRWDLYWCAVRRGASLPDSTNGYTMVHLDTALRAIVPPLDTKAQV